MELNSIDSEGKTRLRSRKDNRPSDIYAQGKRSGRARRPGLRSGRPDRHFPGFLPLQLSRWKRPQGDSARGREGGREATLGTRPAPVPRVCPRRCGVPRAPACPTPLSSWQPAGAREPGVSPDPAATAPYAQPDQPPGLIGAHSGARPFFRPLSAALPPSSTPTWERRRYRFPFKSQFLPVIRKMVMSSSSCDVNYITEDPTCQSNAVNVFCNSCKCAL